MYGLGEWVYQISGLPFGQGVRLRQIHYTDRHKRKYRKPPKAASRGFDFFKKC